MNSQTLQSILTYRIHDIVPYINWIYFFHAWGFQPRFATIADVHNCPACRASWLESFSAEDRIKASEALKLLEEAKQMLAHIDKDFSVHAIYRLCQANASGDNLLLDGVMIPLLRQQTPHLGDDVFLCLSDFVRPLSMGIPDTVGVFAASCDAGVELLYENDPYNRLLVQTLADRLAEAATEKMHEYVRKVAWGYAPDEQLSIPQMLKEEFQGIRPAVGYPSLPDQSVNFLLNHLLQMQQIGISLTENGAMRPHATVCGLMIAHPASRYFAVGRIGPDQLEDYARRRGVSVEEASRFLAKNIEN